MSHILHVIDAFTALHASPRGRLVKVSVRGDRVHLRGQAVIMSKVEFLRT